MIARIYDRPGNPYCTICGSEMTSSIERNFYGPFCKNKLCNGGLLDAIYVVSIIEYRKIKLKNIIKNYENKRRN